ncbi:chemotaxis protein [Polyangium fumosum]|uniref:Chemotaxis protein n=1 Tax=Polyangium fumosum TaxID=889272 RepID=A0A4U1JHK5_9BACT|nr:chemotaxis protein [Polyangium fumosum]
MARAKGSSVSGPDSGDRAVDVALKLAEELFGFGSSGATPGWVRDRVRRYLEHQSYRSGLSMNAVARELLKDKTAVEQIVTSLRVGETRFYRDGAQWEVIERQLEKLFPADVELAVLSAGCSTGEEAYTMGMLLTAARRRFRVLGVDRSAEAIAVAREATYGREAARDIPPAWVERFCDEQNGRLRVGLLVRNAVEFEECDLVKRVPQGPFHIILFKNVLLYLTTQAGEQVATRLANELEDGGLLFSAASEVLRLRSMGLEPFRLAQTVTALRPPKRRP